MNTRVCCHCHKSTPKNEVRFETIMRPPRLAFAEHDRWISSTGRAGGGDGGSDEFI
jgi:hypothetical protein